MIALFTGVETFSWQISDFDNLISFCKAHKVDQIVLKIYEITQGEWYGNVGGAEAVYTKLKAAGLDVLPYGFFYGNDIATEAHQIVQYVNMFGQFCVDMESDFDGNTAKVQALADAIKGKFTGKLFVSTWANPITHNWVKNIELLDPIMQGGAWMPQAYDDALVKDMYAQFPKVQSPIYPTFHVVNTPYQDASPYTNFSLWEYQDARSSTASLDAYVNQNKGLTVSTYPVNAKRMVGEYLQVSQFQPAHSEFECGAFAVALNMRSTNAGTPNGYDVGNLIKWAEAEYAAVTGSNGPSNTSGVSIPDMWRMIKDTQSDPNPASHLNWWDITSINSGSAQDHDIAEIKAALEHGYPVIATVSEQSVFDLDLGRNPYWWGPSGNHIITYVGIAGDGNLLAVDPANVIEGDGNLQTPKQVQPWPRRYDIKRLANQWCTIVRHNWLPPIQSGDPLSWPAYQPPAPPPPPPPTNENVAIVYDPGSKQLMFTANNQVIYRIQL